MDQEQPITSRIGRVAAGWARFEYLANEIIWHLANLDITCGACITAQILSPSSRIKALIALVHLRGGSTHLMGALNRFAVTTDGLARRRNRMVHDPWIVSDKTAIRVEVSADRKLKYQAQETALTEMDALADEIADLIAKLKELYERIKSELPSWPDTQHKESLGKDPTVALLNPDIGP